MHYSGAENLNLKDFEYAYYEIFLKNNIQS